MEIKENTIPKHIYMVLAVLHGAGFDAFLVGGCVRDMFLDKTPQDWDITTQATPEDIQKLFPHTFYENNFGTVTVVCDLEEGQQLVEVTPYRLESLYSDNRHPDHVQWTKNIEEDLSRRDFTCNAIAYDPLKHIIIDPYHGVEDINSKIIRAVRNPDERFTEDGLRLLRAVRFMAQLQFQIETVTRESITKNAHLLAHISRERIRDEFSKLLMTDEPLAAMYVLRETDLMRHIIPELLSGIGCDQNQAHSYDVWEHNMRTFEHSAHKKQDLSCRLAALLHDVSKPETRRYSNEKRDYTFYGHDVVGGRVSREILKRLKFQKEIIDKVSMMVRWHMFFSDTEQITLSAVRRLIANVGKDHIWDLIDLRMCDRIGTGRPKEQPYRFRLYQSMVEQALTEPVTLKMLKIDGLGIMDATKLPPGPKIGLILHALFSDVLDDPTKNTEEWLRGQAAQYASLDIEELSEKGESGKHDMKDTQAEQVKKIRKQFKVV